MDSDSEGSEHSQSAVLRQEDAAKSSRRDSEHSQAAMPRLDAAALKLEPPIDLVYADVTVSDCMQLESLRLESLRLDGTDQYILDASGQSISAETVVVMPAVPDAEVDDEADVADDGEDDDDVIDEDTDYKYLVRLPMDSVTEENIAKIIKDRDTKLGELSILKSTTETQLWLNELAQLRAEYMNMTEKNKKSVSVSAGAGAVSDANTKKKFKVVNKK